MNAYSISIYSRWQPDTRRLVPIAKARLDRVARVYATSRADAIRKVKVGNFESIGMISEPFNPES